MKSTTLIIVFLLTKSAFTYPTTDSDTLKREYDILYHAINVKKVQEAYGKTGKSIRQLHNACGGKDIILEPQSEFTYSMINEWKTGMYFQLLYYVSNVV